MSSLTGRSVASSYTELIKTSSSDGFSSALVTVEDGDGTSSALQISTTSVKSTGTLEVAGSATLGSLTVLGAAVINGLLTANGGTITFGDADTDNVVFGADVNSHILPNTGNTYDLGSSAKTWRNLYLGTATVSNLSIAGAQTISATTQSTSKDTGALVVEGGIGVEKNVNIGGNLGVTGAANLSSTLEASDTISATKATGTGLSVAANATVGGDLTVSGNLTINGTTTNINTTNLVVEDKNIVLADVATPTNTTADGGGITIKGATDKTLNWVNSTSAWTSSEDFNLLTGKVYEIDGASVLSATGLGVGVTNSSLTSVGTIATGTWQGTIVSPTYGGTGVNNASRTITLGGNLTTSGAFNTTLTSTGATNVTLPTTGTLATLSGTETITNKTINLANNTLVATSSQVASAVTDETGTGSLVFGTSPTLTTPVISSIVNTGTLTLPTTTSTLLGWTTNTTASKIFWDTPAAGFLSIVISGTTYKIPFFT